MKNVRYMFNNCEVSRWEYNSSAKVVTHFISRSCKNSLWYSLSWIYSGSLQRILVKQTSEICITFWMGITWVQINVLYISICVKFNLRQINHEFTYISLELTCLPWLGFFYLFTSYGAEPFCIACTQVMTKTYWFFTILGLNNTYLCLLN